MNGRSSDPLARWHEPPRRLGRISPAEAPAPGWPSLGLALALWASSLTFLAWIGGF